MQKFIKISDVGVPEVLIETNDPTMSLPDPEGVYMEVTNIPNLQDINNITKEYSVEVKKDKHGEIEEITFKVKKEEAPEDVVLNKKK